MQAPVFIYNCVDPFVSWCGFRMDLWSTLALRHLAYPPLVILLISLERAACPAEELSETLLPPPCL